MVNFTVRCAKCNSANIEPEGTGWHCRDCGSNFQEAACEQQGEIKVPKRKGKK